MMIVLIAEDGPLLAAEIREQGRRVDVHVEQGAGDSELCGLWAEIELPA